MNKELVLIDGLDWRLSKKNEAIKSVTFFFRGQGHTTKLKSWLDSIPFFLSVTFM